MRRPPAPAGARGAPTAPIPRKVAPMRLRRSGALRALTLLARPSALALSLGTIIPSLDARAAHTVASLAPADAFVIAGTDDFGATRAALERSSLMALWNDKELQGWLTGMSKDASLDPAGALKAAGVAIDELPPPTGAVGLALFVAPPDATDEGDAPANVMHALFIADYGDSSDDARALVEALDKLADHAVREKLAKKDTVDRLESEVTRIVFDFTAIDRRIDESRGIKPAADRPAGAENANEEDFQFDEDEWRRSRLADGSLPRAMHYVRVGALVLASSRLASLEEAMERAAGRAGGPGADDAPDYDAALAQHGDRPRHFFAVLLGEAFGEAQRLTADAPLSGLADEAAPGVGGFMNEAAKLGESLGLDAIRAVSIVARFDAPAGPFEQSIAVLAPEKRGLLAMFDGPERALAPASHLGADVAGVYSFRFNFPDLLPFVRSVVKGMPPEEAQDFAMGLDMVAAQLEPVLDAMGREVDFVTRIEQPFSARSSRSLTALGAEDPKKISEALAGVGPTFGLTPRDFQGQQVWDTPMGVALGVGAGRVFLGETADVEHALREAAAPDGAKLGDDPAFAGAMRALGNPRGVGFSFTRLAPTLAFGEWAARNQEKILRAQFEEMGVPEEDVADAIKEMIENEPAWSREPLPAAVLLRHLGDSASIIRSTPQGFMWEWVTLAPAR